jgi:RNA polymerase sigma factor (sigma-70 family)
LFINGNLVKNKKSPSPYCNVIKKNCTHSLQYLQPQLHFLVIKIEKKELVPKAHIHRNIIEACKKGRESARFELYQLYAKAMYNVCYRMMNSREEAEDMLQEVFTQAFMKLETFRYESSFGSWLKRIAVNTCINAINKRKVELTYCEEIYDHDRAEEHDDYEPEYTVENISRAMEQLPEGGRMIFSLYLLEGYDHAEISQILGITESTSKSQFLRAKRRVAELLKGQKEGGI